MIQARQEVDMHFVHAKKNDHLWLCVPAPTFRRMAKCGALISLQAGELYFGLAIEINQSL